MSRNKKNIAVFVMMTAPLIFFFQNCSNNYKLVTDSTNVNGNNSGSTTVALHMIKPVLAVRGLNCMSCHGVIGSNVITDFGYGSSNFITNTSFIQDSNSARTAFNDAEFGWQSLTATGTVYVPEIAIPQNQASAMFGVNSDSSLENLLQYSTSSMASMVSGVSGQPAVATYKSISITYPSETEIAALSPNSAAVSVSAINVADLHVQSQMSGLAVDSSGNFVRNNNAPVTCTGDVVVKGTLFLNNLHLVTDANGCRLYVTETVFIQGPVTYDSGVGHLQISSARGILLGFSAVRMGWSGNAGQPRTENGSITTPGGPWARFLPSLDLQYNPGGSPINGTAPSQFFDDLVLDAVKIGNELLDAGDPAAVNNLVSGESIITEPNDSENANDGGSRVSIDYAGLLLNAPHVHSRYGGTFKGIIISDVAMLARNPSTQQLEQFVYDPLFDSVTSILPALTTDILKVEQ